MLTLGDVFVFLPTRSIETIWLQRLVFKYLNHMATEAGVLVLKLC